LAFAPARSPDGACIAVCVWIDGLGAAGPAMQEDGGGIVQFTHGKGGSINDGFDTWSPDGPPTGIHIEPCWAPLGSIHLALRPESMASRKGLRG
jgi:hypothetical protein